MARNPTPRPVPRDAREVLPAAQDGSGCLVNGGGGRWYDSGSDGSRTSAHRAYGLAGRVHARPRAVRAGIHPALVMHSIE
jgi:hypothetical protein